MPKIQWSALVSAMSGKYQGSVFSTNRSGSYMRNNSSKVVPKTIANGQRKAKFSTIAQYWRKLSDAEHIAWNSAVSSFTGTGVFGETTTPSGYQLFCSINNRRLERNQSVLLVPPVPRSLPDTGVLEFDVSDLYQFMPIQAVVNFNLLNPTERSYLVAESIFDGDPICNDQWISARFNFGGFQQRPTFPNSELILFFIDGASTDQLIVKAGIPVNGMCRVAVEVKGGSGTVSVGTNDYCFNQQQLNHVAIFLSSDIEEGIEIVVNGVTQETTIVTAGTLTPPDSTGGLIFGSTNTNNQHSMSVSDFRLLEVGLTETQRMLLSLGYVFGNETIINGLNHWINGTGSEAEIGVLTGKINQPESAIYFSSNIPYANGLAPWLILTVENEGLEGASLELYASTCVSVGKLSSVNQRRLIASLPWDSNTSFDVRQQWLDVWYAWRAGATSDFTVYLYDNTTGVLNDSAMKPKKKRFKAGAELSGAVN